MDESSSLPMRTLGKLRFSFKKPRVLFPLLSIALMLIMIAVYFSPLNIFTGAKADTVTQLPGQVSPLIKQSQVQGATDPNTPISVVVGLRMRNQDGLANYIKTTSQAKKGLKRSMTAAQLIQAYAPLPTSEQAVIAFMQQYGFTTKQTFKHHIVVTFQGTVGQAQNAFKLQINNYRSTSGQTFYAPATDPVLPSTLAPLVQSITGLDNATHLSRPPVKQAGLQSNAQLNANAVTCPGSFSDANYYTSSQIASAYNLNTLHSAGLNGEGQIVGLVEFSGYRTSDISAYTSCYGKSRAPITNISVSDGVHTGAGLDGNSIEVELDMELILSAAPNLANLRVYEAPNTSPGSLAMWAQIVNDAVPVVSTSWGLCEADTTIGEAQQENNLFMLAAAQGQSIFSAAGDRGSLDDNGLNGSLCNSGLHTDDPSSQPYVTGVGGTQLTLSGSSYGSEITWNHDGAASGGGISSYWTMPTWQVGPGVNNSFTSAAPCAANTGNTGANCREVPDVALHADFAVLNDFSHKGYLIYCSVSPCPSDSRNPNVSWRVVGGTSAAAPMWAATMAMVNQKSLKQGNFNLGFLNPMLYQISQNATQYSNTFHDVTVGNNNIQGGAEYPATAGYDMATGLGSLKAGSLTDALVSLAAAKTGSRTVPGSTTWYFAEGSVGGSFQEYISLLNPSSSQTASVTVRYLFQDRPSKTVSHTVNASTRGTVNVNADLGIAAGSSSHIAVSAIVTSNIPIVAERPMYFNYLGIISGTNVLGATHADQTSFYFAAGDERQDSAHFYRTFVTILNPSTTQTANVTATYYSGGTVVGTKTIQVGPLQRGTTSPADVNLHQQVAIKITSDQGIVVERPLYFRDNIPAAGGTTNGAASVVGATSLGGASGSDWLFAEGFTGSGFQEYIVLANFTDTESTAHVKLEYLDGSVQDVPVTVPAQSQVYFDVNNANLHPLLSCNCQPSASHSTEVTAPSASIVAERLMYFHFGGVPLPGASDAVGEAGPASHANYAFSEGMTLGNWREFITLQNPGASAVDVVVTLYTGGTVIQKTVELKPHSRSTVDVNALVVPMSRAYNPPGAYEVSASIQALNGSIVAERPLYFQFGTGNPPNKGGTSFPGYTGS